MVAPYIDDIVRSANWAHLPGEQKGLYLCVMTEARRRGLRFAIGGGFASNAYTGMWRNTKDLDLFVLASDREAFVSLLGDLGFADYYAQKPYDRSWIYRGCLGDIIVDIIWQMANHRAPVDDLWLQNGPSIELGNERFPLVPPEETLWTKLYVLQRERCDWPDALNLIGALGPELDWPRLLERMGDDKPLLAAAVSVFGWVCPPRAQALPHFVWKSLCLAPPVNAEARPQFLDSRPWMIPPC